MTSRLHLPALVLLLALAVSAPAKTIVLTDIDCERMAFIQAAQPRWSWGGYDVSTSAQSTAQLYMYADRAFLIAFPLEKVPKGQKILKAELSFSSILQTPGEQKL